MRKNLPVTQQEYDFPPDTTLLSTTDVDSRIGYANAAFIETSGYTHDELMGQPHNIVRHPDMPEAAFADMWATLKAGKSWTALVKNRRKNGDHYWVRANAAPMVRDGRHTGYVSVRTKPARAEIEQAEALYARMREGRLSGQKIYRGLVVRTGLLAPWSWFTQTMSVGGRLFLGLAVMWLIGMLALLGLAWLLPAIFANPWQVVALLGAALTLSLGLSTALLHKQIAAPLQLLVDKAQDVAAGNLKESKGFDRVDEIGQIMRSVNQAGLNLRALVDDADDVADLARALGDALHGLRHLLHHRAAARGRFAGGARQRAGFGGGGGVLLDGGGDFFHRGRRLLHAGRRLLGARREVVVCLLYTSPSPRDGATSRMPSSA